MPTIPAGRRVTTAPLPGVRKRAAETDLSTGATLERQKGQEAEALGELGGTVARIGQAGYVEARRWQIQETERADRIAELRLDNRLSTGVNSFLYDGPQAALSQLGEQSVHLPETAKAAFEKLAGEVQNGATTPQQRAKFEELKLRHATQLDLTIQRHVAGQRKEFAGKELGAKLNNARSAIAANAMDVPRIGAEMGAAVDAIRQVAPSLGLGPEEIKKQVTAFVSTAHTDVITALLAKDQTTRAQHYYDEAKDSIAGEQRAAIEVKLETAGTQKEGLRTATDLWTRLGPKNDQEPINLDVMEEEARQKYAEEPKTLDATLKYLHERAAGVNAARKEREEATSGAVWVAASKGATLKQVSSMPEFLALPGKAQAQVSDYIVNHAAAAEGRAYTAESRAFTREQRGRAAAELKRDAGYNHYANPALLSTMSENAIQSLRGEIGDENTNRLLDQRAKMNNADAVHAATIDSDLFNSLAEGAGLEPFAPYKTEEQKGQLGRLRKDVEDVIAHEEQGGKRLTRDGKAQVMQKEIDRQVMIAGGWFASDQKRIAAVVNVEDREAAYVPTAQIPPDKLGEYVNYIRSSSARATTMTSQQIATTYKKQIERAYAAKLMRLSDAEIIRRLEGK